MNNSLGPWTTAIDTGSTAQLSAFWRRRVSLLAVVANRSRRISRRGGMVLAIMAALALVTPTLCLTPTETNAGEAVAGAKPAEAPLAADNGKPAAAQVDEPASVPYIVLPITTDLQRMLIDRSAKHPDRFKAYVLLDGSVCLNVDGTIDAKSLDLDALAKDLKPLAGGEGSIVCFNLGLDARQGKVDGGDAKSIQRTLADLSKKVGFSTARVSWTYGDEWDKVVAGVKDKVAGRADEAEKAMGNDLVKVYPVRTALSYYLTNNADCVADVSAVVPADATAAISPEALAAIAEYVAKVEVREKDQVFIDLRYQWKAKDLLEAFVNNERERVAESLGYKQLNVRMSPVADD